TPGCAPPSASWSAWRSRCPASAAAARHYRPCGSCAIRSRRGSWCSSACADRRACRAWSRRSRAPGSCRSRRGSACTSRRRSAPGPWERDPAPRPWCQAIVQQAKEAALSSRHLDLLGPGTVGLLVRNTEMAVDAGGAFGLRLGMARARRLALLLRVHGRGVMAVAAFLRVVVLHARPLAHRHGVAGLLVLLRRVDVAG